jgi:methylmalonyl-CoA/ethylmalonyl-CoA epimerase
MQNIPRFNPTFGKLHHVGAVVKDMDKAIAHLESMGLGPFKGRGDTKWMIIPFIGELRGKPAEWKTKICNAQLGDVQLELLKPTEGAQALKESLDETGEGLHHIGFVSDDVDADIAKGLKQGFKIWTSSKRADGKTTFVYFLPTATAKIAIEIRMRNP